MFALGRLRQKEYFEFESILGYIARLTQKLKQASKHTVHHCTPSTS